MLAFAFNTPYTGYRNQLLGAISAICNQYPAENFILLPQGEKDFDRMEEPLCYSHYKSYREFRNKIFSILDARLPKLPHTPRVFISIYNLTENKEADKNVDMQCRVVKEYYRLHNLGPIFTTVLTSALHNYKYVDLINVPKHLLTFYSRIRLLQNKKLRQKTLITIGTIHNFTKENILLHKQKLEEKLQKKPRDITIKQQQSKIKNFTQKNKKVVVCLGGRVEGSEIVFSLNFAKILLQKCETLTNHNYGIVIVNGPRTPNDITDFLYENTQSNPNIVFHNCKNIATNEAEKSNWRFYTGTHENDFAKHQKIGNIYPAILGYNNTLAVHTSDTYSCCETISAGIPTSICSDGIYIDKSVRADCLNMVQLLTPKYALPFEDFTNLARYMKIEPQHLQPTSLSNLPHLFAEAISRRLK